MGFSIFVGTVGSVKSINKLLAAMTTARYMEFIVLGIFKTVI